MSDRTFNDVKINLTLKPQTTRANVQSTSEDIAVQMGKIQQWYPSLFWYGTCSTAAGTAVKTVSCEGFELKTGVLIAVKFSNTNSAAVSDVKLNVNSTGDVSVKYRGTSNLPDKGYLAAGVTYFFVYDGSYYQWMGNIDYNTNNYDRTSVQTRIYSGGVGCFAYSLVGLNSSKRMESFTTTGGTSTSKVYNTTGKFLSPCTIMYHSPSNATAANSVIANNVLYEQYPSTDMRYSANITSTEGSTSFTKYLPVFLECSFDSNGYWSPTANGFTQTLTANNFYILIGCMYSTSVYQIALFACHPIYYYDGTNLYDANKKFIADAVAVAVDVQQTLTSGVEIGSVNGTKLYAPNPTTCDINQGVLTFTLDSSVTL